MPRCTKAEQKFILHWGEMGTRWGINRTVAQIYALLFLSPKPLHAEEIAETLSVARSNVSNSLKELQGWGLIKIVHVMGDRRDYFEALQDVWETFRIMLDERKRREVDPTLVLLQECLQEAKKGGAPEAYTQQRLTEMLKIFTALSDGYVQIRKWPADCAVKFVKWGGKIRQVLGYGE